MKPTMQITGNNQERFDRQTRFPLTDFNYHSVTLDGFNGRCASTGHPSFHTISRDYFKNEACQYFLAEAFVFSVIMLTAVVPMLNGARAVVGLMFGNGGV
jgi:hypothetical protein